MKIKRETESNEHNYFEREIFAFLNQNKTMNEI